MGATIAGTIANTIDLVLDVFDVRPSALAWLLMRINVESTLSVVGILRYQRQR